ncbi:hypothetical protein ABPG73_020156 [Tetrahymena malaccensis]
MQPVQDQGCCGSCWAFTVVSTIENLYSIKYNQNVTLSEQQLLDCDMNDGGCNGGWFTNAYKYVQENGLALQSRYPYIGIRNKCLASEVGQLYKINGFVKLPSDINSIKQALVQKGAIATCVFVAGRWMSYKQGILKVPRQNHCNKAVTVIGYGKENDMDFWIIRNTWGTKWGENGHVRLIMDDCCGIFLNSVFQPI